MIVKLFGGLLLAAGLVAAGIAQHSTPAASTCKEGTCSKEATYCSADCCKDCPNCSCKCECCQDCSNGCKCPNMKK